MPLESGNSKTAFNHNVAELIKANKDKPKNKKRSLQQILAISYSKKKEK